MPFVVVIIIVVILCSSPEATVQGGLGLKNTKFTLHSI